MIRSSRAVRLLLAALVLLGVSSCSSSSAPKATSPSRTPSPTAPAAALAEDRWVGLVDESTGTRFQLPRKVEPQKRVQPGPDGTTEARVYGTELSKDVAIYLSVIEARRPVAASYPRTVSDRLAAALRQQGASDAATSGLKEIRLERGKALDFTFTFTATNGDLSLWRTRTITLGKLVVTAQVISFRKPGNTKVPKLVEQYFDRLTRSIVVP